MTASDTPRTLNALGAQIEILATSEETHGQFAIIEFRIPPGFPGAPPHYHQEMVESFHVLEGRLELLVGSEWRTINAGEIAIVPPGLTHGYRNPFSEETRFVVTGRGHDRFFFELIEWMRREPVWPPESRQALIDFGLRHDTLYI